jgi:glycosyltransferase involved in cell wall biosynthesis
MKKPKVAIIRGKFLNKYEMQFYEPLTTSFDITAFGSNTSFHKDFLFPTITLPCPMDIPEFPYKMSVLNRLFVDAHYLYGLEHHLDGFDLVHTAETYYKYTHQSLQAKKKGKVKKVIATVLENIPFNNEGIHGRKKYKNDARKELDYIIALTERTKYAQLLEGADEKKISVISHFIDTKRFYPKQHSNKNNLRIVFSGRLEKYKGVYEVVYAAAMLLQDKEIHQKLTFIFIGDGSEKKHMLQMEERLGIQDAVQHRIVSYEDMPKQYQEADVYVAPSKSSDTWVEQYNTTLLEAQASGLPIVTTYSGGIPENVGDAAILIPPDDAYALYMELKQFILHPQKRTVFGTKARMRAENVHDIHVGAQKIEHVWEKVLLK